MKRAEGLIRTTPAPEEFVIYSRKTSYDSAKAERVLGYKPRFAMQQSLPLAAAWLKHHGYVATQNGSAR
jgi:nucleoside-diphosphate-sugar epimerase